MPGLALWLSPNLRAEAAPAATHRWESVVTLYARALRSYKAGKLKQAAQILGALLHRYPDHQPSQLLLGRIYFRIGQVAHAAHLFKKLDPELIYPDFAYEYGIALFTVGDCKRARVGLEKVGAGSRYTDLAHFYRGICYMRNHEWGKAETYLARPTELPANLEPVRRRALVEVRQEARSERLGGNINAGAPVIYLPPPTYYMAPPGTEQPPAAGNPEGQTDVEKPPKPVATASAPPGYSLGPTPSMTLTQDATTSNFFGHSNAELETRSAEFKLALSPKYTAKERAGGGQPYFELSADAGEKFTEARGNKVSYVVSKAAPDSRIDQQAPTAASETKVGTVDLNPEVLWPFSGWLDVAAGGYFSQTFPGMSGLTAKTTMGPYGRVDIGKTTTLKLTAEQESIQDKGDESAYTEQTVSAEVTKTLDTVTFDLSFSQLTRDYAGHYPNIYEPVELGPNNQVIGGAFTDPMEGAVQTAVASTTKNWDSFALTTMLTYTSLAAKDPVHFPVDDAPQTNIEVDLTGVKTLEIGGNFTLTGSLSQFQGYGKVLAVPLKASGSSGTPLRHEACCALDQAPAPTTQPLLTTASGDAKSILASFKLAPADWLFGQVSYKYTIQSFTGVDAAHESLFEQAVAETKTDFKIQIGVAKTF